MCFKFKALLIFTGMMSTFACLANEDNKSLKTITVTATRSEQLAVRTPAMVTVITQDDIQRSGAGNVSQILRTAAGIQISDLFGDGTNATVNLRGFGETAQQNTLIMIDGRRLNNTDNGAPDLNSLSLNDIERIEIMQGSASTLYGDKAVGGVINIITRSAETFTSNININAGSYNHRAIVGSVENRFTSGFAFRINAERRLTDNYRDENDQLFTNVFGKLDYRHESGLIFAEYQNVNQNLETPGALFRDQVVSDRQQPLNPNDYIDSRTWLGRVGLQQDLLNDWELLVEYTNRKTDSNAVISTFGTAGFSLLDRNYREWTPRLVGNINLPTGEALITLGYDYLNVDYSLISSVGVTLNEQIQQGLYARAVVPITDKLTMTVGGRHGQVENDIFASTVFLGVALPPGSKIDDEQDSGEFGLNYAVNEQWQVFGRLERNFRFATADEYSGIANFNVGLFPVPPFPFPIPLPDTQTGETYEFGFRWQGTNADINTIFYQLDINDEIVFEPSTGVNMNIGDTSRRGVTMHANYSPIKHLVFSANYNYIDTEITSGVFEGSEISFVADHVGSLITQYQLTNHLNGYLEVQGISGRVFGGDFANTFPRLPGYVISNLNIRYERGGFFGGLRVNNLLDKEYSDAGNIGFDFRNGFIQAETFFPAPERNFFLTFGYTMD